MSKIGKKSGGGTVSVYLNAINAPNPFCVRF